MALELSHTVEEQEDCEQWHFIDDTGTYNATTNPTGYGSPNTASSAVTKATLYILPYGYTTGYLFTFTIAAGVITACTVTAPDGTVTTITADLEYTAFPFSEAEPFVIIGEWLGMGEDSEITSSVYNFEYEISGSSFIHNDEDDHVIVCQVCCCVESAASELDATDCDCECEQEKMDKAVDSRMWLDSAVWAMENGEPDKSYANLMRAKELCEGGCKSC